MNHKKTRGEEDCRRAEEVVGKVGRIVEAANRACPHASRAMELYAEALAVLDGDPARLIIKQTKKSRNSVLVEAVSATGKVYLEVNEEVKPGELPGAAKRLTLDYMFDIAAEALRALSACVEDVYSAYHEFGSLYHHNIGGMYGKLWRYVERLEKMGLRGKLSRSFRERREKAIQKIETITSIVNVWRGWAKKVVDEQKSSKLGRMAMMLEPRYVEWYNALYTRDLGPSVVVEAVEGPLHVPIKVAVGKHEPEDCVLFKIKNALLDVAVDMAAETAEWLSHYGLTLAAAVYRYLIPLMKDMLSELEERRKELKL